MLTAQKLGKIVFEGNEKSGFEDIPKTEICRHPEHEPPSHMLIPPGKQYRHVCPGCGRKTIIRPSGFYL